MSKLLPAACLVFLSGGAGQLSAAPQENPDPATIPASQDDTLGKRDGKSLPQINVNGSRASDMDERRQSTAAKQVYGREELDRNGDTSLGDILKRLPGVTMGGRPGRGGEIRMRGLGSGYTQVLLNGERPPAGFSMDALSPDQVERIEVMRGPVAEHSTRAIAGTINIVLRDGYQQRDRQLKLSDSIEQGRHGPNLSLTVPGKEGALTYLLSASVFQSRQQDFSTTHNLDSDSDGEIQKEQLVRDGAARRSRGIHLTPRLSYKFDGGDTLNFQPFLMSSRSDGSISSLLDQDSGSAPAEYASADGATHASSTFLRGFGNWLHKMQGAAKLDVKFGFGNGRSDSDARRNQYNATGGLLDQFIDSDTTRDRSANSGGKYTVPLGKNHLLAAGWDAEWNQRRQTRVSLDNGAPSFADSGDNLSADTRRFAGFVQDEWDITPQWGAYFGVRWEGIRTTSQLAGNDIVNQSSVWSPLLHGVWRIPGHEKDQVRMSLTRSYRAPALNDLIALPSLSRLNSATRPDRIGNPNLKPELATGIDLAYEHYLGRSGIISIGGFTRNIDKLMRRDISLQNTGTGPRWVSAPANIGNARTSGIELEAKFQLVELMEHAPAIDLRSNYSRFWSNVDGIPGPNNRLDQQARQTANLGLDYRLKDVPLTLGGSFNWTPATTVQTSLTETVSGGAKRVLDVYGLWKFNARTQLRISASNLLADDYHSGRLVDSNGLAQTAQTMADTYRVLNVRLETKF
ncbi:TonB-dependent receptor plug domain-containing protein [Janthinobacterium agaricidamnosum]|nr:TonB-dependent receptor [Janthinobacterium agaricidamnosum]